MRMEHPEEQWDSELAGAQSPTLVGRFLHGMP